MTRDRRRLLVLTLALAAASVTGCEFDKVTVPRGNDGLALHAVLNPFGGREYTVLLERTLSGRVSIPDSLTDPDDPIVSGRGVPERGARVVIHNANGDSALGFEDAATRADGKGAGVYRFINASLRDPRPPDTNVLLLTRGERYRLHVRSAGGGVVTGATTIPLGPVRPDTSLRRRFDKVGDTLAFSWPAGGEAVGRYAVQIQTPYGPYQVFTYTPSMVITGALRNPQADRLPRVFVPGFEQDIQVLAVDSNYFDYYRSANNPFTGTGLITRLAGATGVFGSLHPVRFLTLDVTAPFDEPIEGVWIPVEDVSQYPTRLTLWVEGDHASGYLYDLDDGLPRRGVLGARGDGRLTLRVLERQTDGVVTARLTAVLDGDQLVTTEGGVTRRWRREEQ